MSGLDAQMVPRNEAVGDHYVTIGKPPDNKRPDEWKSVTISADDAPLRTANDCVHCSSTCTTPVSYRANQDTELRASEGPR